MARVIGESVMMFLLILGVAILIAGVYFYNKKKLSLSQDEQLIVTALVNDEQKALADFSAGKEDVIAEYEKLKLKVKNVLGLQAKLPVVAVPVVLAAPIPAVVPIEVEPPAVVEAPIVAIPAPIEPVPEVPPA